MATLLYQDEQGNWLTTDIEVDVRDSGEREYTHVTQKVTAAGWTTLHTPASGSSVRLRYIYAISDPLATTPPEIKISLGSEDIFLGYAVAKRQLKTGGVDDPLRINLSVAATVLVTAILEEV